VALLTIPPPLAARWHDDSPKSNLAMIIRQTADVPNFPIFFTIFSCYQLFSVFGLVCFIFIPVESDPAANSGFAAGGEFVV